MLSRLKVEKLKRSPEDSLVDVLYQCEGSVLILTRRFHRIAA